MVSSLEGVAYSLTAGVARGNFQQMVPIGYWQAKSPKRRAGFKNEAQKKKASRSSPFSNVFPRSFPRFWA
jgi:hypothetical protein